MESLLNQGIPTSADMTRRTFLLSTAAAGAGAAVTRVARAQGPKKTPSKTLNVALFGFGAQGRVLNESLMRLHASGMIKLVALCDVWDYALQYGVRYLDKNNIKVNGYENFEDLLAKEKDVDCCVVATPDFWHAPVTNACLKAGKDVYCEKMMSNTIEGARSMVKTMKETGRLLQIGHQRRSNPRYIFSLNRLMNDAKLCGRITAVNAQWNRAAADDLGWPKKFTIPDDKLKKWGFDSMAHFRNWRWFSKYGGGPLSDLGAHQIDIFNWYLGRLPVNVIAAGGSDYYKGRELPDNAMVIYEYHLSEGVARAFYQVQTTTSAGGGYWEYFMGTDGSIKMSEDPKLCAVFKEAHAKPWDDLIRKNYLRMVKKAAPAGDAAKVDVRATAELMAFDIPVVFSKLIHQPHLENFFKSVNGEAKLNCPADEAFHSEFIIFKANEAIKAKKMIEINPADAAA